MRKLKVYQGSLDGLHSFCVATSSKARVVTLARIEGLNATIGYIRDYWTETGNKAQIAAATAQPGVLMREAKPNHGDYKPLRDLLAPSKFGYGHMVEMAEIKASLADRDLSTAELHFEAIRIYEDRHKDDLTYRQRQIKRRAELAANPPPRRYLNAEEVAYLIDRLGGVNDPVGQSAREVLERML